MKVGSLPFFAQNRLSWQRPLRYRKKRGPDRSSTPKTLSFDVKIAKIGPADPQVICLREIIKKYIKRKKLTEAKYIALPVTLPSGLKNSCELEYRNRISNNRVLEYSEVGYF